MKRLEEFVNEKLKVTKNSIPSDMSLYDQGWSCTSVYSLYNDIKQVDEFLKSGIDLERLDYIDTEEYTKDKVIVFDKVFQAFKRRKWCKKIINIILSEFDFDYAIQTVQENLKNNATCILASTYPPNSRIVRILDSSKTPAMVLAFKKL